MQDCIHKGVGVTWRIAAMCKIVTYRVPTTIDNILARRTINNILARRIISGNKLLG
jgi:hypothetical protein